MSLFHRLYHPEVFQGSDKKKDYFEGWYLKNISSDNQTVLSVIPGIALSKADPHAFIQVISDNPTLNRYIKYDIDEFYGSTKEFDVQIGKSRFTSRFLHIDLLEGSKKIRGELLFQEPEKLPRSLFSPGIMGWYSFVPFMECKHGIVSIGHRLKGRIEIENRVCDFTNGRGYIEKDWGSSMPETWLWAQCNTFTDSQASFMLSIAKIPWLGKSFMGFVGFFAYRGVVYRFATYNTSRITRFEQTGEMTFIVEIEHPEYTLQLEGWRRNSAELKAPISGIMQRGIKESVDSEVRITVLENNGNLLFQDTGEKAGLEIVNGIFDCFTDTNP
ncbi:MAG: tocopherol cyclase family protein [Spirochaetia bacterium]